MKRKIIWITIVALTVFVGSVVCAYGKSNSNASILYGKYIPFKTLDANSRVKAPKYEISYVILRDNNTYELAFKNGEKSKGTISHFGNRIGGIEHCYWSHELTDYRNIYNPSYIFALDASRIETGEGICVLWIPQGIGASEWLETADFWFLRK